MTRAEINAKYGIVRLMPLDVANKELSVEEAEKYEKFTKALIDNFDKLWDDEDSEDIDI